MTRELSTSTPVTSAMITVVLLCRSRMPRKGAPICAGPSSEVATWYSRGWKT